MPIQYEPSGQDDVTREQYHKMEGLDHVRLIRMPLLPAPIHRIAIAIPIFLPLQTLEPFLQTFLFSVFLLRLSQLKIHLMFVVASM